MAPATCRCLTLAVTLLAASGAIIFCAGVGALHTSCNGGEVPIVARRELYRAAGLTGDSSCAYSHGWSWLVVFLNAASVTLAAASLLCGPRLSSARVGCLALVTLSVSFLMPLCNSYLAMHYAVPSSTYAETARAANAAIAGTIIASVGNMLLCIILGWNHTNGDKTITTSCCQKKPAEAAAIPTRATSVQADAASLHGANHGAFIAKQQAAAMMV